jgi:hypothetical protein
VYVAKRFGIDGFQYELVENWPTEAIAGVATTVAADSKGRVYVGLRNVPPDGRVPNIRPGVGHILVLNPDGTVFTHWDNVLSSPHAVWINANDEVFVADTGFHTITRYAPTGELLMTLGTKGEPGAPGAPFNMPTAAVQAPNGDILVSDGYGQNRVHRFTERGDHIVSFGGGDPVFLQKYQGGPITGQPSTKPGEFNIPHDVLVDANSMVHVMDRENGRWHTFTMDGDFVSMVTDVSKPFDAALDADGNFHILGDKIVEIWTPDGKKLGAWGEQSDAPGHFGYTPHGCWMDAEGSFFVAEVGAFSRLFKYRRV